MANQPLKVGVLGLGLMGSRHAELLQLGYIHNATLAAVCDLDPNAMEPYRRSRIPTFTSFEEMISKGKLDAIIIATPHENHVAAGVSALQAGLHVLMEKPMTSKKSESDILLSAAKNPDQVFAVNLVRRTEPILEMLKKKIDNGELGQIHRWSWTMTEKYRPQAYYDMSPWRGTWEGGGGAVLMNQAIHYVDLANWLFGVPSKVTGHCSLGKYHPITGDDEVHAFFHYPNKAMGTFITSTGEYPGTNRLEISCDAGKLVLEDGTFTWNKTDRSVSDYTRNSSRLGSPSATPRSTRYEEDDYSHEKIVQNFVNAIQKKERLIAPAKAGAEAVEVANAIILSSVDEKPVSLPMSAREYDLCHAKLVADESKVPKRAPRHVDRMPHGMDDVIRALMQQYGPAAMAMGGRRR